MERTDLVDLNVFTAVAEYASFTQASVALGTSQSAVSYAIRRLETRLGVRLFNRSTRSVVLTTAGEKLIEALKPTFQDISASLESIRQQSEHPQGRLRIAASEGILVGDLWEKIGKFIVDHPFINIEFGLDGMTSDIVTERFDAGIRLGEDIDKDMIAVRIGPEMRMAVVGAIAYFENRPLPTVPADLSNHVAINYRRPLTGRVIPWEFAQCGHTVRVRVSGQLVFNRPVAIVRAALDGHGLACVPEHTVKALIDSGALIRVLEDWCPSFSGFHLYYSSRRQMSAALRSLVDALKM